MGVGAKGIGDTEDTNHFLSDCRHVSVCTQPGKLVSLSEGHRGRQGLTLGDTASLRGCSRLGKAMRGDSIRSRLGLLSLNESAGPRHSLSLSLHLTPGK